MYIFSVIFFDRDVVCVVSYIVFKFCCVVYEGVVKVKYMSVVIRGVDGVLVEGEVKYEMEKIKC